MGSLQKSRGRSWGPHNQKLFWRLGTCTREWFRKDLYGHWWLHLRDLVAKKHLTFSIRNAFAIRNNSVVIRSTSIAVIRAVRSIIFIASIASRCSCAGGELFLYLLVSRACILCEILSSRPTVLRLRFELSPTRDFSSHSPTERKICPPFYAKPPPQKKK